MWRTEIYRNGEFFACGESDTSAGKSALSAMREVNRFLDTERNEQLKEAIRRISPEQWEDIKKYARELGL